MTDTASLRDTVRQLEADVARLRELIDAQDDTASTSSESLSLPPEIYVPRPSDVAAYLHEHLDMAEIVVGMGENLVGEFKAKPSRIELDVATDDYVDEQYLIFNVRVRTYDESLMRRIDRASAPFDEALAHTSGWIVATTDFGPVE